MAKPLKKAVAGEPFQPSTKLQNATVEAIRYVEQLKASGGAGPGGQPSAGGILQVKNNSGVDRNRFDVLGIDDVFPAPTNNLNAFKAGPVLHGITPAMASHLGKFAILLAPAKISAVVPALVAGVGVAKVNITDTSHRAADVKDGDAGSLASGGEGAAKILWAESGIGVKWCVVRIGGGRGEAGEATVIKAQVKEAGGVATTDATFNIDNATVMLPPGSALGTTPTVVNNILGFPAQDNAAVIAFYNQTTGLWEGIPAPWFFTC